MAARKKPRLAVFKFASCDGCQLSLLDLEDELLAIGEAVEIAYFLEAQSKASPGPYDVTLVDGSITTAHDAVRIREVRQKSRKLVAIGACATAGGIQALRNFGDVRGFLQLVYPRPEQLDTLATSTAIAEHVPVDFELTGCPIDRHQLLEVLSAMLAGRRPVVPSHSVCVECKLKGNACVMVLGTPCLGPVTKAGCGALCPTYARGCYGCFGPSETTAMGTLPAMERVLRSHHVPEEALVRAFRSFNANAPRFRAASEQLERQAAAPAGARPVEPRLGRAEAAVGERRVRDQSPGGVSVGQRGSDGAAG